MDVCVRYGIMQFLPKSQDPVLSRACVHHEGPCCNFGMILHIIITILPPSFPTLASAPSCIAIIFSGVTKVARSQCWVGGHVNMACPAPAIEHRLQTRTRFV
ncbi:unnamed protein product [Protopolystoma xenopodis]|uniref:Uncharacterized protein n=1 Tax=Protopolystoma xenopodis TaxID=117903 RepID=A0A3S5ALJ2_9PLAT|nr:unnamed protein product [Protopolystoma xenopodis]